MRWIINAKYSKEFRDSTVQLIINHNRKVIDVAEDLGIRTKTLYDWVTQYKKLHNISIRGSKLPTVKESEHDELKRLRRENKILKEEKN